MCEQSVLRKTPGTAYAASDLRGAPGRLALQAAKASGAARPSISSFADMPRLSVDVDPIAKGREGSSSSARTILTVVLSSPA